MVKFHFSNLHLFFSVLDNVKALFRRAKAHVGAWNPQEAQEDFNKVMTLDPSLSTAVQKELKNLEELKKQKDSEDRNKLKGLFSWKWLFLVLNCQIFNKTVLNKFNAIYLFLLCIYCIMSFCGTCNFCITTCSVFKQDITFMWMSEFFCVAIYIVNVFATKNGRE